MTARTRDRPLDTPEDTSAGRQIALHRTTRVRAATIGEGSDQRNKAPIHGQTRETFLMILAYRVPIGLSGPQPLDVAIVDPVDVGAWLLGLALDARDVAHEAGRLLGGA